MLQKTSGSGRISRSSRRRSRKNTTSGRGRGRESLINGRVVAVDKPVEGSDPERYRVFVPAFEGRPKTTIDLKPTNKPCP
jgi:hypothetical protein